MKKREQMVEEYCVNDEPSSTNLFRLDIRQEGDQLVLCNNAHTGSPISHSSDFSMILQALTICIFLYTINVIERGLLLLLLSAKVAQFSSVVATGCTQSMMLLPAEGPYWSTL
jgi:hypothetical protein